MRGNVLDTTKRLVPSAYMTVMEDFVKTGSASVVTKTGSGTFALLANTLSGVGQIDTGAGADQDTSIGFVSTNLSPNKNPMVEARIRVDSTLGLGTAYYKVAIKKDADEVAQLWVDASGNVKVFVDGGTAALVSNVDTGYDVVAGTWYRFGVQILSSGKVVFTLDGAEIYRTANAVADTTSSSTYNLFIEVEDNSAAQHKLDVDYIFVSQDR